MRPLLPRLPLATWLTLAVLATVLAAVASTLTLVEVVARPHAEHAAASALRQIARDMRDGLDRGMSQHVQNVQMLATLPQFAHLDRPDEVRRALDRFQGTVPAFAWLGVARPDGHVLAGTGGLLDGADVTQRPWFKGAREGLFLGDVHPAVLLSRLLPAQAEPWRFVDVAVPLKSAEGGPPHILAAHLSWGWARQMRDDLMDPMLAQHGADVWVVDKDGVVVLGPHGTEGTRLPRERYIAHAASSSMLPAGAALVPGVHAEDVGGQAWYVATEPSIGHGAFSGLGWTVLVRQPEGVAMADFDALRRQLLLAGGVLALVFLGVSIAVGRRLAAPLNRLAGALAGEPTAASIPREGAYREAALLADALASLLARQDSHAHELEAVNASLETRIAERTADLQRSHAQLADAEARLREIADNLPVLIGYIDRDLRLQFANETFRDWFGVDPATAVGRPLLDVLRHEGDEIRRNALARAFAGEPVRFETTVEGDGVARHLDTQYLPHLDAHGQVQGVYKLSADISAMKAVERQLRQLARVDTLTQLPNRREFEDRLPQAQARARRLGTGLALLFLDVDHFKKINDSHGHAVGDAVLRTFAERLRHCVRTTDTVARLAGDEFVIVLEGLNVAEEARIVASKIDAEVRREMQVDGCVLQVSTSIGIAFDALGRLQPDELLSRADDALYAAKEAGRATWRMVDVGEAGAVAAVA